MQRTKSVQLLGASPLWVHHAIPTDSVPTDAIPTMHSRDVGKTLMNQIPKIRGSTIVLELGSVFTNFSRRGGHPRPHRDTLPRPAPLGHLDRCLDQCRVFDACDASTGRPGP